MTTPTAAVGREELIKTYRYLRLGMVVLLVLLVASVVHEALAAPGCLQDSISAYYYTPVRAIFVASLVAIGVCMIVLKSAGWEDALLNAGGMLASVVALVPTPGQGTCRSVPDGSAALISRAAVDNNIWALFVAGVVGVLLTVLLAVKGDRRMGVDMSDRRNQLGIGLAAAIVVAGFAWFVADRDGFTGHAHDVAAVALFACIIGVVVINAVEYRDRSGTTANRYGLIAVTMLASVGGLLVSTWVHPWDHWTLAAEGVVIVLFALFWLVQTDELWNEGPRRHRRSHPVGSST